MDFTAKMANEIAAAQTPEPAADPVEDVKEMIDKFPKEDLAKYRDRLLGNKPIF